MRSVRLLGGGKVVIEDVPKPVPGDGQVLVRVRATAICGSERHAIDAGREGNAGHEAVGVVGATGELVGVSAVRGCGACSECLAGVETRCLAGPSAQLDMHAEYLACNRSQLRVLPEGMDPGVGVLLAGDTLGVPARALSRVPTPPDGRVLVVGLGPVGLGHVVVRAHQGAEVVAVEPSAYRRELALSLGASRVVAPGEETGSAASLVIEASGTPRGITFALEAVAAGGTVLQSGECAEATISPSSQVIRREVTYTGCWYFTSSDFPAMLELHASGLPLERLITHQLPADQAQAAFDAFSGANSGKVVLRWDG